MDRRDGIVAELKKNEEEIIAFYKGWNSVQLDMTVYEEDDSWTMQQVLAHFITIEQSMQWLFKNILAGGPGSPEDFDFERFNRTLLDEWAYVRTYRSETERIAELDNWLHTYNHHRHHTAIGGPPISRVTNLPAQHS